MSVALRLTRRGTTNRPHYRIVATDSRKRRDGRHIEVLGWYDPVPNPVHVFVDLEKADQWISKGAKASETVARLIKLVRENGVNLPEAYNLKGEPPKQRVAPVIERRPVAVGDDSRRIVPPAPQRAPVAPVAVQEATPVEAEEAAAEGVAEAEAVEAGEAAVADDNDQAAPEAGE